MFRRSVELKYKRIFKNYFSSDYQFTVEPDPELAHSDGARLNLFINGVRYLDWLEQQNTN
ncbi:MAG: hypothetical protein COV43_02295 [Deltaproteobacteria bacterium CG11_big_fil_rev_8_21_14_0_20_42_23]|nr:MAG: hypothetical protein COV43_02295 [Deltaproteobacteria bacterium CG11_big_fil_rev_8_21_14_0_20_42_23]